MNKTIVVCDDDAFIRRSVQLKLSRAGYDIRIFPNGQQALEAVRESKPDLIISDLQMPKMNGIELCEALQSDPDTASIPVILLTAKGFELDTATLECQFGIQALVNKPFGPQELLDHVNRMMSSEQVPAS